MNANSTFKFHDMKFTVLAPYDIKSETEPARVGPSGENFKNATSIVTISQFDCGIRNRFYTHEKSNEFIEEFKDSFNFASELYFREYEMEVAKAVLTGLLSEQNPFVRRELGPLEELLARESARLAGSLTALYRKKMNGEDYA